MMHKLHQVLQCRQCKSPLVISTSYDALFCSTGHTYPFDRNCLIYGDFKQRPSELSIRDQQAAGYLKHLNDFHLNPQSVGLLLMADFLQHLGGAEQRQIFLHRMID